MKSMGRTVTRAALSIAVFATMITHAGLRGAAAPSQALLFDGVNDHVTLGNPAALGLKTFTLELWFRRDGAGVTTSTSGVTAVPLVTKGRSEGEGSTLDMNYFLGIDGATRTLVADFEDSATGANHPVFGTTRICDGIWNHAAATYDGTTWRLYLNGVQDAALTVGAFQPRFNSIQRAAIASALTSTSVAAGFFKGAIDEVRIWNYARPVSDIQAGLTGPIASAGGLVGRWALDEGAGTTVADSSGNASTGTTSNGPTWVSGSLFTPSPVVPGNYAIQFGGASDYVSFGPASGLGSTAYTIEAWFKRTGTGVTASTGTGGVNAVPLVSKGRGEADGNNRDMNYFLGIDAGNHLVADFEEGAAGASPGLNHPVVGTAVIASNVWYHAAASYDGTTWKLYLNGSLDKQLTVNRPARADSIQHAAIGSALNSTGVASGFFNGVIDEVRIWNYARTVQQVAGSMSSEIPSAPGLLGRWSFNDSCGAALDLSGGGRNGTLFGPAWKWVAGAPVSPAGTTNVAPTVTAGADVAVTLPAPATLSGVVTDDGVPAPVTSTWTRVSGPGTVTYANANAAATTATFSAAGTYVLRLTATDGLLANSDDVSVQVNAAAPVNQPPVVDAGPDRAITLPDSASLAGSANDDGLPGPMTAAWGIVSGPGGVTFGNPSSPSTTATFSVAGTYVLSLSANDGALGATDNVTVTVNPVGNNTALRFSGSGSYATFGPAPSLGASTFTLEAWFRRIGTGQTASSGSGGVTAVPLVTKGRSESDGSNVDMNYFLGIDASGHLVADFEEGAGGASPGLNHPVVGSTVLLANAWYHGAATYDGSTWRLYVNGVQDGQVVVGRPPRSDSIQHAAVGTALNSTGAAAGFFDGVIDEVRIWNVARGAQLIADNMNSEIASASGLVGRWGMNDASGTTIVNSAGSVNGSLVGANWSRVPGAPFSANRAPGVQTLNAPANGATGVSTAAALDVSVSDPDQDNLTVTFFGRPVAASTTPDFTLMTIPDTQHYVDSANYETFTKQTQWIVANRNALNIAFVTHLGDIVQNIDNVPLEWQRADTSISVLDAANMPYNMSPGNHDITPAGVANFYDQYFPPSRYLGKPWYAGYLGQEAGDINRLNKDNYELFSVGSLDFVIIHLEMDIPDYSLAWADRILKRYPNRRAILSTHIYLNLGGVRPTSPQFRSNGTSAEQVWQQLVRPNCNVFLFVNGHYHGEGMRTDLNSCGQPVHQVLQDYQARANGGDGWLRYFTFKPSQNKIEAYTFSPTRNGGLGEFENDADSRFTLDYAMQATPFTMLGTAPGLASGSRATFTWPGRAANTRYEWYVTVSDGKTTTVGPTWTFTTQ